MIITIFCLKIYLSFHIFNSKYSLIVVANIFCYTLKTFLVRYFFTIGRIETDFYWGKRVSLLPFFAHGVPRHRRRKNKGSQLSNSYFYLFTCCGGFISLIYPQFPKCRPCMVFGPTWAGIYTHKIRKMVFQCF